MKRRPFIQSLALAPAAFALAGLPIAAHAAGVELKAPEIAENGAVVPVTVYAEGATKISIYADANPEPFVASFDIPEGTRPEVSTRIKLGESSNIRAVAVIDGNEVSAEQLTKVTIGGCGG